MAKEEQEKSKKGAPHFTPLALFDNLEFMITFTFAKTLNDIQKVEFESRVKLCLSQSFYESTDHKYIKPTFNSGGFKKGNSLSVYFHFNPIYLLKQKLVSERRIIYEKGLRKRDTNFLPPELVTKDIQNLNLSIAIVNLLGAIEWACCLIKLGANNVQCSIKFSILHTEAVIDTRFSGTEINDKLTFFVKAFKDCFTKKQNVKPHRYDSDNISGCTYLTINRKRDPETGKIKYFEKVGSIYKKTPTILRFEYISCLKDTKYRFKDYRFNIRKLQIESIEDYKQQITTYLTDYLNKTEYYYRSCCNV
jgi:hypothetical protein